MHSRLNESPVVGARTHVEPANGFPLTADIMHHVTITFQGFWILGEC